jgi:amino acid transporter
MRISTDRQFFFAMLKIALVFLLIIGGIVIDLGGGPTHDRIGFRYYKDPGAFAPYHTEGSLGYFLGFFTNLLQSAGSFSGIESIVVAAAEVKNPRIALAKAVRRLFWRIAIFYVLLIFVVGLLVPYNDPQLLQSTGTAASSPFVLAFTRAGVKGLPHVINAIVLSSAVSAGSSLMYSVSRMFYGMALRGYAPRIVAKTTKKGLPIVSLSIVTLFYAFAFMSLSKGASTVLNWLSNLNAL